VDQGFAASADQQQISVGRLGENPLGGLPVTAIHGVGI